MAAAGSRVPGTGAPAGEKKGEVNELRALLRTVNTDKDSKRKRDVIKKVIAYMTLGIDVSRLFSDMILACNTKDIVIKKMVYLYLCAHAQSNPELTLLAINTLQKDCRDDDPMVRGLALRSLTGLRLVSILEYVLSPLKAALTDSSGYVRQAGVLGVLKVFHLSASTVKDGEFVDTLYAMMRDREPQVVINCISALTEILADEGGIAINQAMILYLLGRMREFNDWAQCVIMDNLICKYTPANEDELFGIMNLLDGCLRVSNSAVVLSCTKCFLRLTATMPDMQAQVYLRLKTPLLTMMASSSNEIAFAVLSHVALIVEKAAALPGALASAGGAASGGAGGGPAAGAAGIFDDEYKQFFAKYTEPSCVKSLKMTILPYVANAANGPHIISELSEYVGTGVDSELAKQAIRAIGHIALRVPVAVDPVMESLLECSEMEADYVRSESMITMQDLLRAYPDRAPSVIPSLQRSLKRMESPAGRCAVIWMLGEYGQIIPDAPYQLEPLIDAIKDEGDDSVKCEILTATVKLFFKRPPEVQRMMGRLFKHCLTTETTTISANVKDRALMYYRLLRSDVHAASGVIGGERAPVVRYDEEKSEAEKAKIWAEFNTLSVLYGKPSEAFIAADHRVIPLDAPSTVGGAVGGAGVGMGSASGVAGASSDGDTLLGAESGGGYGSASGPTGGAAGGAGGYSGTGAVAMPTTTGTGSTPTYGAPTATTAATTPASYGGVSTPAYAPNPAPTPTAPPAEEEDLLGLGSGFSSMGVSSAPAFGATSSAGGGGYGSASASYPGYGVAPAPAPLSTGGLGFLATSAAPTPAPAPTARPPLRAGATLDPTTYQAKWGALPVATTLTIYAKRVPTTAEVEALARAGNIYTIASGDVGTALKFYFFGGDSDNLSGYHLLEVNLDKGTGAITATVKSDVPAAVPAVARAFAAALAPLPTA